MNQSDGYQKLCRVHERIKWMIGKGNVLFLLCIFPILFHNKLYDLTVTRYYTFLVISFLCFGLHVLNEIIFLVVTFVDHKRVKNSVNRKITVLSGLFLLAAGCAYMVSPYQQFALAGFANRYVGLMFMAAIGCSYFTISSCYVLQEIDLILAMAAGVFVNGLAILNYFGIDLFQFFVDLAPAQSSLFISTMGNVDVYGVYALMTLSISLYSAMKNDSQIKAYFYLICAFIAACGTIVSGSDAAFLGVLLFMVVSLYMLMDSITHLIDWLGMLLVFVLSIKGLDILISGHSDSVRTLRGWFAVVSKNMGWGLTVILTILIFVLAVINKKWNGQISDKIVKRVRKIYMIVMVCTIVAMVIAVIFITNGNASQDAWYSKYVVFNDEWGSGRGFIWKNLLEGFHNFPVVNKILGMGEATIRSVLSDYSSIHWNLLNGQVVDSAHNIPLQILITEGIFGFAVYIAMIVNAIQVMINKSRKELCSTQYLYVVIGLTVIVCFVQSLFCILEVITFPIFMCYVAMMNGDNGSIEKEITKESRKIVL